MRFALTFSLFLSFVFSYAQPLTQTLRGRVLDNESEMPLPGATVAVTDVDPMLGATTDMDGYYVLENVPIGRHTVKVTFIGYKEVVFNNVLLGSGKEVVLNVKLTESLVQMDEVVVKAVKEKHRANNDMATVSARSFSVDEAARYAASIDDPARMAQAFAGVATSDDVSNEIIVRGNSPRGLLWRLNGIEIPSPNHFTDEGTSGGGVSTLSNNMLDNSDFFTGAFPAEYGNALSGVFDVKLRKGNVSKHEFATQIGVLGTDVSAEGPFKKGHNGSFLVNYRYSTLGLLNDLGFLDLGGTNTFQDLAFNLHLPTKKAGTFGVFALGGLSKSGDERLTDTTEWESPNDAYAGFFNSDMGVAGITHQYFLNNNTYLKTVLATTAQRILFEEDSLSPINQSLTKTYNEQFVNSAFRLTSTLNKKINAKNTVKSGFILSRLQYNLRASSLQNGVFVNDLLEKSHTYSYQVFGQWKHKLSEKWTINAGVHYLGLALTQANSVEPRAGINYQINKKQSFSFGLGMHSRMESMAIYNANVPQLNGTTLQENQSLGLTKSMHYVLGYDRMLNENVHLKIETYYQQLSNIPISPDTASTYAIINESAGFTAQKLVNEGTGYNVGAEITFERFFSKRYYYMLTASVFDSKYKDIDGNEYNTRFNTNYRITILGGKEFPVGKEDQNLLEFNAKYILSGGNRYTPINLQASQQAYSTVEYTNQAFAAQVPDYWRFDLTVNYRINRPTKAHILSLNIQNVTNRINLFGYYYDAPKARVEPIDQFGLLPVLKYRLEF